MTGEFSVCQFYSDGTYEYVRRFIPVEEAVKAAIHYTASVGVKMGVVKRVIITDGGDCIAFEWTSTDGIVFPPSNKTEQKETK